LGRGKVDVPFRFMCFGSVFKAILRERERAGVVEFLGARGKEMII
jgi:hypothetical protein